jgi:hypothetical protein
MTKLEDDIDSDPHSAFENYGLADYHLPLYNIESTTPYWKARETK